MTSARLAAIAGRLKAAQSVTTEPKGWHILYAADVAGLLAVAEAAATLAALDPVYPTEMDAQCPYCVGHFAAVGGFIHADDCPWLALTAALGDGEPGA